MYRIEVSPGEETVLRTIEELATAIRNGLVTPRSRIYHNASEKWLPIEFHPHYKKALALSDRPRPVTSAGGAALRPPPAASVEPAPAPAPSPRSAPPAPSPAPARGAALPPAVASLPLIEVELPEPKYPDPAPPQAQRRGFLSPPAQAFFSPVVSHQSPVVAHPAASSPPVPEPAAAPMPVARRRSTGGRPLLYAGSAVVLVVGGYMVTTAVPSSQVAAEAVPAARSEPRPAPEPQPAEAPAPAPEMTVSEGSVEDEPQPVITSGVTRRGPRSQAWSSSAGAIAPPPAPAPANVSPALPAPAIAPAPGAMDLNTASLQVADSLAPKAKTTRDTGAIGRILKAVGAPKSAQEQPAQ